MPPEHTPYSFLFNELIMKSIIFDKFTSSRSKTKNFNSLVSFVFFLLLFYVISVRWKSIFSLNLVFWKLNWRRFVKVFFFPSRFLHSFFFRKKNPKSAEIINMNLQSERMKLDTEKSQNNEDLKVPLALMSH